MIYWDIHEVSQAKRAEEVFDELNLIADLSSGKMKKVSYKAIFSDTFNLQLKAHDDKKNTGAIVVDSFGHRKVKT